MKQIIHVVKVDLMKEVILRTRTTTQVIPRVFGLRPQTNNSLGKFKIVSISSQSCKADILFNDGSNMSWCSQQASAAELVSSLSRFVAFTKRLPTDRYLLQKVCFLLWKILLLLLLQQPTLLREIRCCVVAVDGDDGSVRLQTYCSKLWKTRFLIFSFFVSCWIGQFWTPLEDCSTNEY